MEALPVILQAEQHQLDVQVAALQLLMEKLCAVRTDSSCNGAAVLGEKYVIFDSLNKRIEALNYDPDRGRTFDSWLRYHELFDNECTELDEKDKTRGFECFKVRYEGEDFNSYQTMAKTKCTDAHFYSIDFDSLQCLHYVAGFQRTEFADHRARLLRRLDQSEKITPAGRTSLLIVNSSNRTRMMPDLSKAHLISTLFVVGSSNLEKRGSLNDDNKMSLHPNFIVVDHIAGFRDTTVAKLKTGFTDVFVSGLGKCTTAKATLLLKPNSQPIFKRQRPVPYATVAALDNEIDRLLAEGVISPVTYSRWVHPSSL
ncbi:unnamed protein product [Heligmosomoides polygyrus]|uniref:SAM-dependent MTase TRM10-type domain-containing protein n=1 Tax=Heligmosomoides polygyrus TaxID=6339 RepID=A0A183GCS8_HELPZ|nr:unnamed protein product [Heligmosomoides polygyrus]